VVWNEDYIEEEMVQQVFVGVEGRLSFGRSLRGGVKEVLFGNGKTEEQVRQQQEKQIPFGNGKLEEQKQN